VFAISNDELGPPLGSTISCPHCGQEHAIHHGERVLDDGTREPSDILQFYKCGDTVYLAGIRGLSCMEVDRDG
jgi:hypothetical protein